MMETSYLVIYPNVSKQSIDSCHVVCQALNLSLTSRDKPIKVWKQDKGDKTQEDYPTSFA